MNSFRVIATNQNQRLLPLHTIMLYSGHKNWLNIKFTHNINSFLIFKISNCIRRLIYNSKRKINCISIRENEHKSLHSWKDQSKRCKRGRWQGCAQQLLSPGFCFWILCLPISCLSTGHPTVSIKERESTCGGTCLWRNLIFKCLGTLGNWCECAYPRIKPSVSTLLGFSLCWRKNGWLTHSIFNYKILLKALLFSHF